MMPVRHCKHGIPTDVEGLAPCPSCVTNTDLIHAPRKFRRMEKLIMLFPVSLLIAVLSVGIGFHTVFWPPTFSAGGPTSSTSSTTTTTLPINPPSQVCGSTILYSPYSYTGAGGAYASGTAGLPTYGAGNSYPLATHGFVINAGNFAATVPSLNPNYVYYFVPGNYVLTGGSFDYFTPDASDAFIGGYTPGEGVTLSGNGASQSAFVGHATNISIEYMQITDFVSPNNQGLVNHDNGTSWTIEYDNIDNNGFIQGSGDGAGIMGGTNEVVEHNCLDDNGQYGLNAYCTSGCTNINFSYNEITGNGLSEYPDTSCGCSGGVKFYGGSAGDTEITVTNNYFHANWNTQLWYDTNVSGILECGNYLSDPGYGDNESLEISYNAVIGDAANDCAANTFVDGGIGTFIAGDSGSNVSLTAALYVSESGGNTNATTTYPNGYPASDQGKVVIENNNLINNFTGISVYNNTQRAASTANPGDPSNTLAGTSAQCVAANYNTINYLSQGCQWVANNVYIENNIISVNPTTVNTVGNSTICTSANLCGFNAMFTFFPGDGAYQPTGCPSGGNYPYTCQFLAAVQEMSMCGSTNPCTNSNDTWANNSYYYGSAAPPEWWAYYQGQVFTWWTSGGTTSKWNAVVSSLCLQANETCTYAMGQDAGSTITLAPSNTIYDYPAGTLPTP
jgi:hypothetical protein